MTKVLVFKSFIRKENTLKKLQQWRRLMICTISTEVAQRELRPLLLSTQQAAKDSQQETEWKLLSHILNSALSFCFPLTNLKKKNKLLPLLKMSSRFITRNSKQTRTENNKPLEETASCISSVEEEQQQHTEFILQPFCWCACLLAAHMQLSHTWSSTQKPARHGEVNKCLFMSNSLF